jgi:membrane-bound lytic murein transglycosylase D
MKVLLSICVVLALAAPAQDQPVIEIDPAVLLSVQEWVQENVDDKALDALGVDRERAGQFLRELQKRLQDTSVYDLASLRDTATVLLPVLQKFEETRPYAAWLRTHSDYLDVSEKLRGEVSLEQPRPQSLTPQRGRSVWVTEVAKRPVPPQAARHLPRLKAIFAEEKIPAELVWVAEVESSFDPAARSPAGAAGMFQLMPQTAKGLDLSLWPRDERLQPEKNARAAAKYLRQLRGQFGDWRLAIAAYNAGPGRIGELLKKHGADSFDGISSRLPSETQMYVPKVEAVLLRREGKTLGELKI